MFNKKRIPPRAFWAFACAGFIAFFVATDVAGFVIDKASPFVIFGGRAKKENIAVVINGRGLIKFSNGVELRGVKLIPFDLFFGCATCLAGVPLWWALIKSSIVVVRIFSPAFAKEVSDVYRELLATFRVQTK